MLKLISVLAPGSAPAPNTAPGPAPASIPASGHFCYQDVFTLTSISAPSPAGPGSAPAPYSPPGQYLLKAYRPDSVFQLQLQVPLQLRSLRPVHFNFRILVLTSISAPNPSSGPPGSAPAPSIIGHIYLLLAYLLISRFSVPAPGPAPGSAPVKVPTFAPNLSPGLFCV